MDFKKFEDEPDNENSRKVGDNTNAHLTDNSGTSGGDDDVRLGQLDFEFRRNPVKTWFRMMFPHLKIATLSVGFVIIFVIIYLFQLLLWRNNEWKCVLYSLGSDFTPAIKRWQVQRLITADFLHNDWAHLLWNCFVLLSTGCNAEHYLKLLPYAILAFASILLGNVFGAGFRWNACDESVGASTLVSGILAFELFWFIFNWDKMGKSKWLFALYFSTICFTTLLSTWAVGSDHDFWGHLGGFLGGVCVTGFFYSEITKYHIMDKGKFAFIAAYVILFWIGVIGIFMKDTTKCYDNICSIKWKFK